MNNQTIKKGNVWMMLIAFGIYSSSSIAMKLGSSEPFLSLPFFCFYLVAIIILSIYAIMWQMILKSNPLNVAFLCKSSTVIFTTLYGIWLFDEQLSVQNICGILLVVSGIIALFWKK